MSKFTVYSDIDVALSLTNSKRLMGDLLKAKTMAMIYYVEELIHKHFDKSNPNVEYKYKPNKLSYEMWKRKYHPNSIYQMVLSGRLREAVFAGKVDRATGEVVFDVPEYGIFQLKAGRNFTDPSFFDDIVIQNKIREYLFQIRSMRAKLYSRK